MPAQSPLVSAALLYDTLGNVSSGGDVHAFLVIYVGGSAYPSYGSRWLQKFRNVDGMLARWYLLLGQCQ